SGLNSPWCSSAGRLFDAVAAILGICSENTYEGQAPALLGERAKEGVEGTYGFTLKEGILYPGEIFAGLLEDLARGEEKGVMAAKFHNTVVAMLVAGALKAREESGEPRVALSGGLFQNPYLFRRLVSLLRREGFLVHYHRQVPPNDGGLALGQAVVGFWRVREG
ncbi:MAG: carbamoyltransferase HypF, partial [Firmicutes bacterium]|nr:carbamoyltransferase HypF [Bacillota bacterium]